MNPKLSLLKIVFCLALVGCARPSSVTPTLGLNPLSNAECTQMQTALTQMLQTDSACQSDSDCVIVQDTYATCTNQMDSLNRSANSAAFLTAEAQYYQQCQSSQTLNCMNYITPHAACVNNSCTFGSN
jgi:hypothetical protein